MQISLPPSNLAGLAAREAAHEVGGKAETVTVTETVTDITPDCPTSLPAGLKDDAGKPQFHCLDARALLELGQLAAYGARHYNEAGIENWRRVPNGCVRYYDAAFRHLLKYRAGEAVDPDSGVSHLIAVVWNCLALFAVDEAGNAGG